MRFVTQAIYEAECSLHVPLHHVTVCVVSYCPIDQWKTRSDNDKQSWRQGLPATTHDVRKRPDTTLDNISTTNHLTHVKSDCILCLFLILTLNFKYAKVKCTQMAQKLQYEKICRRGHFTGYSIIVLLKLSHWFGLVICRCPYLYTNHHVAHSTSYLALCEWSLYYWGTRISNMRCLVDHHIDQYFWNVIRER